MPDISFDDLIPKNEAAPSGLSFDDLIPKKAEREVPLLEAAPLIPTSRQELKNLALDLVGAYRGAIENPLLGASQLLARGATNVADLGGNLPNPVSRLLGRSKDALDQAILAHAAPYEQAREEAHGPGLPDVNEMAGAMVSPANFLTISKLGPVYNAIEKAVGKNFLSRSLAADLTGAILGAEQPVYNTDNFAAEKAKQMGVGAALGQFGEGVASGSRYAGNFLTDTLPRLIPGTKADLDATLLRAARQQNQTPADLAAQYDKDLQSMVVNGVPINVPVALSDSGPAMRKLAYRVTAIPGEGSTIAERFLEGRQRGTGDFEGNSQYDRMTQGVKAAFGVQDVNAAKLEDALKGARKAASTPAYEAFENSGVSIPVQDILQQHASEMATRFTPNNELVPALNKAYAPFINERYKTAGMEGPSLVENERLNLQIMGLDKKIEAAQEAGNAELEQSLTNLRDGLLAEHAARSRVAEPLSPELFDNAKRQLYEKAKAAKNAGEETKAGILFDLHNRLVKRAEDVTAVKDAAGNPVLDAQGKPLSLYRTARESFKTPTKQLEALEAGRGFLGSDLDRVNEDVSKLTPSQQQAYRVGGANALITKFGDKNTGNNIPLVLDTPNIQTRVRAAVGKPNLDQINALRDLETRMFQTRNRAQYGSQTEANRQITNEADLDAAEAVGRQAARGRWRDIATDAIIGKLRDMYKFREKDAAALARELFEADPVKRAATHARLAAKYGQQQTAAAISTAARTALLRNALAASAPLASNALTSRSPNALALP